MRVFIYSLLLCSFSTLASVTVNKDTNKDIILDVSEVYVLGDNDTLTDAKAINIEQAKKNASDYAGTYVESELKLLDGKITKQQVRVLTAGFVEVLSRTDKREINKLGSIQLNTKAKIKLSKQSIKDGIAKLKSDPDRQAKIKSLSDDNKRLRNKLLDLTKKINTGTSRQDLMAAREEILKDLNKNRSTAKQVFEEGTLLQLAELDNDEFELAKKDIDENLFGYFKNETKIELGKPKFTKNHDGTYNIIVPVAWKLKRRPADKLLSKYFDLKDIAIRETVPYGLSIYKYTNSKNKQKLQYTEKLLDYINSRPMVIKVSINDNNSAYIPLVGYKDSHSYARLELQFSNDSKTNRMIVSKSENPVIIERVRKSDLNKVTSINAVVDELTYDNYKKLVVYR